MEDIPPYTCLMPFSNSMLFNLTPLYVLGHRVYLANKEGVDIAICGRILNECPDAKVKNTFFIKRLFNTIKFFKFISSGEPAKIGIEKELEKIQFDLTKSKEDIYHQITRNLDILNNVL